MLTSDPAAAAAAAVQISRLIGWNTHNFFYQFLPVSMDQVQQNIHYRPGGMQATNGEFPPCLSRLTPTISACAQGKLDIFIPDVSESPHFLHW